MELPALTDGAILAKMGDALRRERLNANLTQMELAGKAGIGARTLRKLEGGEPATLETLIRVLRALGRLGLLNALTESPGPSPLQLSKLDGRRRRRASGRRRRKKA